MFFSEPHLFYIVIILLNLAVSKPQIQFHHELGTVVMDETHVMEKVKIIKITKWTLSHDTQVRKMNVGTIKDPKYLKLNVDLKGTIAAIVKGLL